MKRKQIGKKINRLINLHNLIFDYILTMTFDTEQQQKRNETKRSILISIMIIRNDNNEILNRMAILTNAKIKE